MIGEQGYMPDRALKTDHTEWESMIMPAGEILCTWCNGAGGDEGSATYRIM